ncbi:MAG: hypothetical protein LBG80_02205 [Bacteroidales bacterium]|jgi:hypothetical protein|nr:hypothetical protein [Bacteroidales bacterium]
MENVLKINAGIACSDRANEDFILFFELQGGYMLKYFSHSLPRIENNG